MKRVLVVGDMIAIRGIGRNPYGVRAKVLGICGDIITAKPAGHKRVVNVHRRFVKYWKSGNAHKQ